MRIQPLDLTPDYRRAAEGLRKLHQLEIQGLDEGEEADAIRDEMDGPWSRLTDVEQARLKGLSQDLFSISVPRTSVLPPDPKVQRAMLDVFLAQQAGDWDRAMGILRRWKDHIEPDVLAFLRGEIWSAAGDVASATLFFEHAHRLRPEDPDYRLRYTPGLDASAPPPASLASP